MPPGDALRVLIGKVHVDRADLGISSQIEGDPFPGIARFRTPPGLHVLVRSLLRTVIPVQHGGRAARRSQGQEMPARVQLIEGIPYVVGHPHGVVAPDGVGVELPVRADLRREQAEAPLEQVVHADGDGVHLPELSVFVGEQASVARSPHEARGLVDGG